MFSSAIYGFCVLLILINAEREHFVSQLARKVTALEWRLMQTEIAAGQNVDAV